MERNADNQYRELLRFSRPEHGAGDAFSLRHPKMQLSLRAKIFSPFAALTGFEEAIEEKLALYVEKRELSEEEQRALDAALSQLAEQTRTRRLLRQSPVRAEIRFFVPCPDPNHEAYGKGGSYVSKTGAVRKVDAALSRSLLLDDERIAFADLAEIRILPEEED